MHGNTEAINLIVTVFSILAGFLIAVITLVGDPASLPSGSWRLGRLAAEPTYNRLIRYKWLFMVYLITLGLIFISMLFEGAFPKIQCYLEYLYLFFASFSCILSFMLPSSLIELQKERIEQEIDERRKQEGIED